MAKKKKAANEVDIRCKGTGTIPFQKIQKFQGELKRVTDTALMKLKASIMKNGFRIPIFMWNGKCLDGHTRIMALESLQTDGWIVPPIPVVELEADNETDARKVLLLINSRYGKIREQGFYDFAADLDLSDIVNEVMIPDVKIEVEEKEQEADDQIPDMAGRSAFSRPGDKYIMGDHVLICGDSTSREDVRKLMAGETATMVFTDPPYNVDYGNHGNKKWGKHRKIENDKMDDEAWQKFLMGFMENILGFCGGAIYICMSCKEWGPTQQTFQDLGGHWSTTIIWAKDRFTLGRSDYQRQYEPILYGWKEGAKRYWIGERDIGDVWEMKRPSKSELHPTMKPVELVEKAVLNSSRGGDIVMDLFTGSGTTLIACEKTGRRFRGMELDAIYCDTIVARWEEFTGKKAKLVRPGQAKARKPAGKKKAKKEAKG